MKNLMNLVFIIVAVVAVVFMSGCSLLGEGTKDLSLSDLMSNVDDFSNLKCFQECLAGPAQSQLSTIYLPPEVVKSIGLPEDIKIQLSNEELLEIGKSTIQNLK